MTAYPYAFSGDVTGNSYADVKDVQTWFMTYRVGKDEYASVNQVRAMLITITAEIDMMILTQGGLVPPAPGAVILPFLQQTASVGAAAWIAHSRYESGDEQFGPHAKSLMSIYDANLGLLERGDANMLMAGVQSAGWLPTPQRSLYYSSGNLQPDRNGNPKTPYFTSQDQY